MVITIVNNGDGSEEWKMNRVTRAEFYNSGVAVERDESGELETEYFDFDMDQRVVVTP